MAQPSDRSRAHASSSTGNWLRTALVLSVSPGADPAGGFVVRLEPDSADRRFSHANDSAHGAELPFRGAPA